MAGHILSPKLGEFWWRLFLSLGLVLASGLCAGLLLGLLSLDMINLGILKNSGTQAQRKYAAKIIPIRRNGHLLLVTLLIANTLAMEALPLVMDSILSGGWLTLIISTILILIFSEIIPQAVCSRYGLTIGAHLAWLVKILIVVEFIVAWPISKFLDWVLGKKEGIIYRRTELKELVNIHEETELGQLTADEATIIRAVLDFKDKSVNSAFTPLDYIFMLDCNDILTFETMQLILEKGHSRIPVYENNKKDILGIVLAKKLMLTDPSRQIPIRDFAQLHILKVPQNFPMFDMLNLFQEGKGHMAAIENENGEAIGIITLEDVIEELIGEEIIDETDVYIDVTKKIRVVRNINRIGSKNQIPTEIALTVPDKPNTMNELTNANILIPPFKKNSKDTEIVPWIETASEENQTTSSIRVISPHSMSVSSEKDIENNFTT